MSTILRVDMDDQSHKWEAVPKKYETLGGRAFTSAVINDEVDPTCHPLREFNKIVIAPGLLAGTAAPSSGRLSIGGKSPLTGGIKEANAGGLTANRLGRLGIKGIIIEGAPPADSQDWYSIVAGRDSCSVVKTNDYAGIGCYELIGRIWKDYPVKPGIIGCGITGQRLMKSAGVFGNDLENRSPGRYAARGGLGAVFGSKRVLAVISDSTDGAIPLPKDKDRFDKGREALHEAIDKHVVTGKLNDAQGNPYGELKNYGTNILQNFLSENGALPTRGFSSGRFSGAARISGEAVHELVDRTRAKFGGVAEGRYAHPCQPGCVIACSNIVPFEDTGKAHVSPLEYESAWAFGSNLDIDVLHDVAELNRLCNDLGLDAIETGNALAMLMEGGVIEYGDGPAAIETLKEVYKPDSIIGRLIASGTKTTGETLGVTRIPVVKGQAIPAYDPRPIRGIGVTYATTPMGADHTAGYTIAAELDGIKGTVTDPRELKKAELSRYFQALTAYIDATGYCLFIAFPVLDNDDGFNGMVDSVNGFLGKDIDVIEYGLDVLKNERDFNKRAGFTAEDDRLPEFFKSEPLPPHKLTFDVSDEEIDTVFGGI
ncbi:aldehyde ferredoxin oxidoreductase [Candidatus Thorarchaeota archaeon]|nr:MAG: aldehyde ferredoxin oxidoreductase [Candidatus Thorarchaeota archaeon]